MVNGQESHPPVVMAIGGCDPTGGAGIQADIEAIASLGAHAAPVLTAVTVQDTSDVIGYTALDAELVVQQARAVLADMPVACFKLGMLASVEVAQAVHTLLAECPDIPVVLDPVLVAGGGGALGEKDIVSALSALLPLATVMTPNTTEARALAPEADNLDACAIALLAHGPRFVLITGGDAPTPEVVNTLYAHNRRAEQYPWQRLTGSFHGSGCTLAAAIAAGLAHGREPSTAVYEAQNYTWQSLNHGYRPGHGQLLPQRLFWAGERG